MVLKTFNETNDKSRNKKLLNLTILFTETTLLCNFDNIQKTS